MQQHLSIVDETGAIVGGGVVVDTAQHIAEIHVALLLVIIVVVVKNEIFVVE